MVRITPLLLAVGLLAPAGAQAAYRDFQSPTGKLACVFYSDAETPAFVRCDWRGSDDQAVHLRERGKARLRHVTDTVFNPDAKVLGYGHRMRFHALRCRSRRSGIRCSSTVSGHGFLVTFEKRTLF